MSSVTEDIDLFDPEVQEDWYPSYTRLREEAPVYYMPKSNMYILTKYDDIHFAVRHPDLFTNQEGELKRDPMLADPEARAIYKERGYDRMFPLSCDPPLHRCYRSMIESAFSRSGLRKHEPLIHELVDSLIDTWIDKGEIEFISAFCDPLPQNIIATILGFPREDLPQLADWSAAWVLPWQGELSKEVQMMVANKGVDFQNYIIEKVRQRRAQPQEDLISDLAHARLNDERLLDDAEIIGMIDHLFIGGNETTTFSIASGMWLLISNPLQLEKLRNDRSLIKNMVEEVLRMESPTQGMPRIATQDVELSGVTIPKGATVHLRYGAANRDPDQFSCPASMDVERNNAGSHMAFSQATHACPGANLSRIEMIIAFEHLLDRLDDIQFAPHKNDFTHLPGFVLRALNQLHITFRKK